MAVLNSHQPISGLNSLGSGLNYLRRSKMMTMPEFKCMYGEMEKHHNDIRLAHLTGKAKDLQENAIRDTKFFNILIKMLCEVKEKRSGEQRTGIKKVYNWYMANKHVLYSGPKFGKEARKEKAKEYLQKAAAPSTERKLKSDRGRPMSSRNKLTSSKRNELSNSSTDQINTTYQGVKDADIDFQEYKEQLDKFLNEPMDKFESTANEVHGKTDIRSDSRLKDSSLPQNSKSLGPSYVHTIPSLMNPHALLAEQLAPKYIDEDAEVENIQYKRVKSARSRPDNLKAWQSYNKNHAYGQDILNNQDECDDRNRFMQQSLEEFYKSADAINPTPRNRTIKPSHSARIQSASVGKRNSPEITNTRPKSSTNRLGHQLDTGRQKSAESVVAPVQSSTAGVRLDTVMTVIDAVSDDMLYYKEKLTPDVGVGFRQPTTSAVSHTRSEPDVVLPPPIEPIPTPTLDEIRKEVVSAPTSSIKTIIVREDVEEGVRRARRRCQSASASAIDWRGKIQPDTVRYKWSKTKFGGHTYLRHLQQPGQPQMRSRPQTAPLTRKLKTPRDKTNRPVQAATHNTEEVRQEDVDNMVVIQHLLASTDRSDSYDSLFDMNSDFWKMMRRRPQSPQQDLPMEFLSFITPPATSHESRLYEQETVNENEFPDLCEDPGIISTKQDEIQIPTSELQDLTNFENNDTELSLALKEGEENLSPHPSPVSNSFTQRTECSPRNHVKFVSVQNSAEEKFSKEDLSQFLESKFKLPKRVNAFKEVNLASNSREAMPVQRSAGRMPSRTNSASAQMHAFTQRYNSAMKQTPPQRTPASIPISQPFPSRTPNSQGQMLSELERHARKTRSPRNFLQKINGLRTSMAPSPRRPHTSAITPSSSFTDNNLDPGISLTVCKLAVPSNDRLAILAKDQKYGTEFLPPKPMSAPAAGKRFANIEELHRNKTEICMVRGSRSGSCSDESSTKSYSQNGRPIPQITQIPDPDHLHQAVMLQKQAAAAVDIQRIFRGYVARNLYKNLQSEEIGRKEEERRAAVRIQSLYRGHLARKRAILNRQPLNPELVTWARDFKRIQKENAEKRQTKMNELGNELNTHQKELNRAVSVIGPHVDVYQIYHPKQTGPSKRELDKAAISIQRLVRGWIVRRKMEKLSRKATWYGSSFQQMVKDYKRMILQVQVQHGVEKPETPFSIKEMNEYIDLRRRYESVFEKKAFGGEIEKSEIESFFKECDLYPSQAEINDAIDVTLKGSERDRPGLKKKELLSIVFYIYTPNATGLLGSRQSTWMNPIINGQEARKLLGSEFVEAAPLEPCANLVANARREQVLKEKAQEKENEKKRIEQSLVSIDTKLSKTDS